MSFVERRTARIEQIKTSTLQAVALLRERRSALITAAVNGQLAITNDAT